jgi:flagellar assembly protein FliH
MSSSNIISSFALADESFPVGSQEFIDRFYRERREQSPQERKFRQLEEKYEMEVQQAFQNGLAQGRAAGLQQGMAEAQKVQSQLHAVITELVDYQHALYEHSKAQLLELAFAIADKITSARAVTEQPTVIESINRCIAEILDKTRIKVKVNPTQYDYVKGAIDALTRANESISSATVEADTRVSLGGCLIETDSGSADARIESEMQVLREKLLALEQ